MAIETQEFTSRKGNVPRPQTVVIWERCPAGWKVVEGEIGGAVPRVRRSCEVPASGPKGGAVPRAKDVIMVVGSRSAVCRELEMPDAPPDEMRQMIELRVEAELPYPSAEAAWAYDRAAGAAPVLLLAMPSADLAVAEGELNVAGRACEVVESCDGALAQLAAWLAPGAESVALVHVAPPVVSLVVAHRGRLGYARSLAAADLAPDDAAGAAMSRVAGELDQTLRHYAMGAGGREPEKVLVTGEPELAAGLAGLLADRAGLPAEVAEPSDTLGIVEGRGEKAATLQRFAPCVGALVGAHCRLTGRQAAAPPLRKPVVRERRPVLQINLGLAVACVLLLVAVTASAFGLRSARIRVASGAVERAEAVLGEVERLEEEVRILQKESERHRATVDLLREIVEALPDGMDPAEITVDSRGKVTLTGKAPSVEAASKAVSALKDSARFTDAKLLRVAQEQESLMFRITCVVVEGREGRP